MAQSLSKYHSQAFANLLLCLLVVGAAGYLILADMRDSLSRERALEGARVIAGEVSRLISSQRSNLKTIVQQPEVLAALRHGTASSQQQLANQIQARIPQAQTVHLLSTTGINGTQGLTSLVANYVDLIQRGAEVPTAEFHDLGTSNEYYDLVEPVVTGNNELLGYLVMSISSSSLHALIERQLPDSGYLELRHANQDKNPSETISFGERARAGKARGITVALGDVPWTLTYWSGEPMPGIFAGNRIYYALFILFAVTSLLVMSFGLYRRTREAIHHDIKSVGRMFRDVRQGDMRNQYPMKLEEFSPAFLYLQDSGRKLVEEKEKLKGMGLIDHLSQLSNRRYFEMRLNELFEQKKAFPPSSVLIIDIDQFKSVNDRYGHKAGDALIVGFADALRQVVRQSDFLARLGGDEFCVIYPYVTLTEATVFADRLRKLLPRQIPLTRGIVHNLRWSGGVSIMSDKDPKYSDVLWRADQALILAKEGGRNRTKVYDPIIDQEQEDVRLDPFAHHAKTKPKLVSSDTNPGGTRLASIPRTKR